MFPDVRRDFTLAAVGLLISLWLLERFLGNIPFIPSSPLTPALILFGLMVIVGVIVTADPDLTHPKAFGLLLGFAYWRYFATAVRTRRALIFAVLFFLLAGIAMTYVGAVSADWRDKVALLSNLLNRLPSQLVQLPGAAATHTNELGGTIVIYLPLFLAVIFGWRPISKRPLLAIPLLGLASSAVLILLLSQSRSAWIGTVGGLVILATSWFLFLPKSRLKQTIQIGLGLLALLFIVVLTQLDWNQVSTFIEEPPRDTAVGTFTTLNFRRQLWGAALEVLDDTPYTGTGLGAFRRVVPRLYPISASDSKDVAHAHNILLQVAVDTGLPGLIAYLTILITISIITVKIARRQNQDKLLILGLFASLIGLHLFGLTDALAPGAKPGLLFWIALGLVTALYQLSTVK